MSLAVEQPHDGAELDAGALTTTVIGQASEIAQAGLTKIAIVIDTSGSTADPSGSDADVEGSETVLDAEKAAAEALISALVEAENDAPGTAFAISVIEFGDTAHSVPVAAAYAAARHRAFDARRVGFVARRARRKHVLRSRDQRCLARAGEQRPPGPGVHPARHRRQAQPDRAGDRRVSARGSEDVVLHTIGLGTDFRGDVPEDISYPPVSEAGPVVLAHTAASALRAGASGRCRLQPTWSRWCPYAAGAGATGCRHPLRQHSERNPRPGCRRDSNCVRTGPSRRAFPSPSAHLTAGWSNVLSITATGVSGATARREVRLLAAGLDPAPVGAGRG